MVSLNRRTALVFALSLASGAATALPVEPPAPVSPGDTSTKLVVEGRCPTFSWSATAGAARYELVIYRLAGDAIEADPVLRESFPASVNGWTPSLDRCLQPGESYAWTLRAVSGDASSKWAAPALFQVAMAPSLTEIAAAIDVIRRSFATDDAPGVQTPATSAGGLDPLAEPGPTPMASTVEPPDEPAALQVEGEIRGVSQFGQPRLWGRGRTNVKVYGTRFLPGSDETIPCFIDEYFYGLSATAVDWGSAADACPAGSWVCGTRIVSGGAVACNTVRPDDFAASTCDGSDLSFASNQHLGWISHGNGAGNGNVGQAISELSGGVTIRKTCYSLPVWCCWQAPS